MVLRRRPTRDECLEEFWKFWGPAALQAYDEGRWHPDDLPKSWTEYEAWARQGRPVGDGTVRDLNSQEAALEQDSPPPPAQAHTDLGFADARRRSSEGLADQDL